MSDHQGGQVDNRLHGHAPSHNYQSKVHIYKAQGEINLLELCLCWRIEAKDSVTFLYEKAINYYYYYYYAEYCMQWDKEPS